MNLAALRAWDHGEIYRIIKDLEKQLASSIISADSTKRDIYLDLYDLYEIGTTLLVVSMRSTMRSNCKDKSA